MQTAEHCTTVRFCESGAYYRFLTNFMNQTCVLKFCVKLFVSILSVSEDGEKISVHILNRPSQ